MNTATRPDARLSEEQVFELERRLEGDESFVRLSGSTGIMGWDDAGRFVVPFPGTTSIPKLPTFEKICENLPEIPKFQTFSDFFAKNGCCRDFQDVNLIDGKPIWYVNPLDAGQSDITCFEDRSRA